MNLNRFSKLHASLKTPLLIKKKENLFYLTGHQFDHRAEEYLLVLPSAKRERLSMKGHLLSAKRYPLSPQAVGFGSGLEQINWIKKSDQLRNVGQYLKGYKQLDIEYGFTYGEGEYLKSKLQTSNIKVKPARSAVDVMRMTKERSEIELIKNSMQIVERVFFRIQKRLHSAGHRPAITERQLANFIQSLGLKLGAEDISFPAIVACGPHAAIPHHVPDNTRLKTNQSIIIDFGFKYKHYCSDFTRTVFLKSAPKKLAEAYNQVEKAYNKSIEFIAPPEGSLQGGPWKRPFRGVSGNDVYQQAVDVLAEKHLDKYFIHSLGHGTGLEIHELPNLSPKSKDIIQNSMVFSIEPGVYFTRVGGIRIEDLVYLEKGNVKKFINVSTKLTNNII